ncbi:Carbohydrate kinase PfkB [Artemisia annua]|uniref:Carbohydrate kinase PfkB n=1 Tax=Artemisia annua TaxID=35608 RepID=A0A2U1QEW0_ARTAN|nr:Carbohydrate kinase PfkB [Artemisia annua]
MSCIYRDIRKAGPMTREELGRATWTFIHNLGAQVQQRNQDSKETQFAYSKSHVMSVSKSANSQDNKPQQAISLKKLCLSNKILQKEVHVSTNRLEDTAGDPDHKSNLIVKRSSISLIIEPCKSANIAATKIAKDAGVLLSYDPNLRLPL